MVCYVGKPNSVRLAGGNSGASSSCIATPVGLLLEIIMREIDVSTPRHLNAVVLVDDSDFSEMNKDKWGAVKFQKSDTLYAARYMAGETVYMHRVILGLKKGDNMEVDHRDGDGLNNQRSNLRRCTHQQNMANSKIQKNNTSGYKGVYWNKTRSRWTVRIKLNGKWKYLGRFFCIIRAAKAYDEAAIKYYGEFARPNFPT